jgi:hypothetical protein
MKGVKGSRRGSFGSGGYNRTIAADRGSPIAGRQAWSGNSNGFHHDGCERASDSEAGEASLADGQRHEWCQRRLACRQPLHDLVRGVWHAVSYSDCLHQHRHRDLFQLRDRARLRWLAPLLSS